MKNIRSLRTGIIILIGGAALALLQLCIVQPRQKAGGRQLRALMTKARFQRMAFEIMRFERDYGKWPAEIDRAVTTIYPEFLSDPAGNSEVHRFFDDTGGWVYDPEKRRFYVNLEGTVGEILDLSRGGDLSDSRPSEWTWSYEGP